MLDHKCRSHVRWKRSCISSGKLQCQKRKKNAYILQRETRKVSRDMSNEGRKGNKKWEGALFRDFRSLAKPSFFPLLFNPLVRFFTRERQKSGQRYHKNRLTSSHGDSGIKGDILQDIPLSSVKGFIERAIVNQYFFTNFLFFPRYWNFKK